jgi:hypothetical protein
LSEPEGILAAVGDFHILGQLENPLLWRAVFNNPNIPSGGAKALHECHYKRMLPRDIVAGQEIARENRCGLLNHERVEECGGNI